MKRTIGMMIALLSMGAFHTTARPAFNKSKDFIMIQFDAGGDEDDIHCMAAFACMQLHSDLVGVNEYIVTGARLRTAMHGAKGHELLTNLFGTEGPEWTSAWKDWNLSVRRVVEKVKPVIQAGGTIWVVEGGQSDFTADWIKALVNDGISLSTIKTKVVVVQHSTANENFGIQADLNYVRDNTDYYLIPDGNSTGNGTAGYATFDPKFYIEARSKSNTNEAARKIWDYCDDFISIPDSTVHNPRFKVGGVDFSDLAELWWILELGDNLDDVEEFWNRYVVNSFVGPSVSFVSPENNQYIKEGTAFTVEIDAVDFDGSIRNVKLYLNNTLIGEKANAPWRWKEPALRKLPVGTHEFKAIATDNDGHTGEVTISVPVTDNKPEKIYKENGGYVIMEIENAKKPWGKWELLSNYEGYNGSGFLEYTGNTINGGPADSPLIFKFTVNQTGVYELNLRVRNLLEGATSDKCNDAYVRLEGDFTSGNDVPLYMLKRDTKIYNHASENWNWTVRLDLGGHQLKMPLYYLQKGQIYTLVVSGRSTRLQVDRIVIHNTDVPLDPAATMNESKTLSDPKKYITNRK